MTRRNMMAGLNEAMTARMGEPRTAQAEIGRLIVLQNRMRAAGQACHTALAASEAGGKWLAALCGDECVLGPPPVPGAWPTQLVIKRIGESALPMLEPVRRLCSAAVETQAEIESYDRQYAEAHQQTLAAAATGRLILEGQLSPLPGSKRVLIPREYCRRNVTIDGDRRHLIPDLGPGRGSPGYRRARRLPSPVDLEPVYFDVMVHVVEARSDSTVASTSRQVKAPQPSPEQLAPLAVVMKNFIIASVGENVASAYPPVQKIEAALTRMFGELKRDIAREFKRVHFPQKGGRFSRKAKKIAASDWDKFVASLPAPPIV
jgi:hypothetical protein